MWSDELIVSAAFTFSSTVLGPQEFMELKDVPAFARSTAAIHSGGILSDCNVVVFAMEARRMCLIELAHSAGVPLGRLVNLDRWPIRLQSDEAEQVADALGLSVSELTYAPANG